MNAKEIITRLKELQVKCLPDYGADEKKLHFKWYLDTPDAIELARMIIDLDESMTDALTELEAVKKRAEKKRKDARTKESPTVMLLLGYEQIIELIDFIIKGEGK